MTIFTQPLTGVMEKINHLVADRPALQQEFDKARRALVAAALKVDLSTPFTEGGDIRTELDETPEAGNFRLAEALLGEAERNRNTVLKGVTITAGSVAGAALGGLALREAHRRGWIAGTLRAVNKSLAPRVIARRYGKLAGTATRLVMEGKATTVIEELDVDADVWEGRIRLTGKGFTLYPQGRDGAKISIPFDAVTRLDQALDHHGNVKHATLYVAGCTPLEDPAE